MATKPPPKETARQKTARQIKAFVKVRNRYEELSGILRRILEQAVTTLAPLAQVEGRAKTIASFADKIQRKSYRDPVTEITDLAGVRVIARTRQHVDAVCDFIRSHFEIDWKNTVDNSQRLKPSEFGYRSIHYIVSAKPGVFPTKDIHLRIPHRLFPDLQRPMKAEIQVRTVLEHGWADIAHDLTYKQAFKIPDKLEREMNSVSAELENCDNAFGRVIAALKRYAAEYGSYMPRKRVQEQIAGLETVRRYDRGNLELCERIGRLAITIEDWQKARSVLSKPAKAGYEPALRDLGIALCKQYRANRRGVKYRLGQKYLRKACELAKDDVNAWASLASTWKGIRDHTARDLYRQAFELDPSDPYPLGNYLDYIIARHRNTSVVPVMSCVIKQSMQRCRDQAEVGTNMPWAYYSLGRFHLLLGQPYESLAAYAMALQQSTSAFMVESSLASLDRIAPARRYLPGYEWVRRLLHLGLVAGFRDSAGRSRIQALKKIVLSRHWKPDASVVIVAGGCDLSLNRKMQGYRKLMIEAFRNYTGTVISGGTRSGICGLVGEIGAKYPGVHAISYLPRTLPKGASIDKRYTIRRTGGKGFSPLEPLQHWIDLVASGVRPAAVKVLGINGGSVSGAEYRIALALGAQVVVLEDSGREVAKLMSDDKWGAMKNLLPLPADPGTVGAFIGTGIPKLKPDKREIIAQAIHQKYQEDQREEFLKNQASEAGWENLSPNLKESNRLQADDIFEKLRRIGCGVQEVKGRTVAMMSFTPEEIEIMAQMEHARWNVERLMDGWKYGPVKDRENKISPHLVSWDKLLENVQGWDRKTVRRIPYYLAKVGLEIVRSR